MNWSIKYLLSLFSTLIVWGVVFAAIVTLEDFPAPRMSDSSSFNERAKWLRRNLVDRKCDVMVLGSSIALSSVDVSVLEQSSRRKVVSLASYGLTIEDDYALLQAVMEICLPTLIIMPVSYVDFTSGSHRDVNWPLFINYVSGGSIFRAYGETLDAPYYVNQVFEYRTQAGQGRSGYEQPQIDAVDNIDCSHVRATSGRWDAYVTASRKVRPAALVAMNRIAQLAKNRKVSLAVVSVPMRPVAEKAFSLDGVDGVWTQVSDATRPLDASFVRIRPEDGFDDSLYSDFDHMNECGARKWTRLVVSHLARDLANLRAR